MPNYTFYECTYYVKAEDPYLGGMHDLPVYEIEQSYTRNGVMFTDEQVKAEFTIDTLKSWGKDVIRLGKIVKYTGVEI